MGNSCTSVFPNTCAWEQQERSKTMRQTKTQKRGVSMEKSTAGTNKRSPDGLSHPNRNTIITNNLVKFYKKWKSAIKFN